MAKKISVPQNTRAAEIFRSWTADYTERGMSDEAHMYGMVAESFAEGSWVPDFVYLTILSDIGKAVRLAEQMGMVPVLGDSITEISEEAKEIIKILEDSQPRP